MMEAISKIVEFIGKYAWAVFVTTCFVLFIPEEAAKQLGLRLFREHFKGGLWILLVLTWVVSIGVVFQYIDRRILDRWLESRRRDRDRQKKDQKAIEALEFRLNSLDANEKLWIEYCLFHNTQTLSAERGNGTAQSLNYKNIVEEGTGNILDLPFHIPDRVWRYLLDHSDELLPEIEQGIHISLATWRGLGNLYGPSTKMKDDTAIC